MRGECGFRGGVSGHNNATMLVGVSSCGLRGKEVRIARPRASWSSSGMKRRGENLESRSRQNSMYVGCVNDSRKGAMSDSGGADCARVVARWTADVKFGCKREALTLIDEWLKGPAKFAGVGEKYEARVLSGAVGAKESRIEISLHLQSLQELEDFFANVPGEEQALWSRRLQPFLIGTTRWEIYQMSSIISKNRKARQQEEVSSFDTGVILSEQYSQDNRTSEGEESNAMLDALRALPYTIESQRQKQDQQFPTITTSFDDCGDDENVSDNSGLVKPSAEDFANILDADPEPGWLTGNIDLSGLKNVRGYEKEN